MAFKVTISDTSNPLIQSIESVVCRIDTPDDDNARSTDIGNIIQITGRIGAGEPTIDLYKWSLLSADDSNAYRNVEVEMTGAQGELLKKVTFPNTFVVDYSESYSVYNGEGSFIILLKQKKDKNDKVQVEGDTAGSGD